MFHFVGAWNFVWGANPTKAPPWRRDCVQPKCLTGSKIRSISLWGPHMEWHAFIL